MKNISFLVLMFLLASCATLNLADLRPDSKNSTLLPTLEPRIDRYSFENAYSSGYAQRTYIEHEATNTETSNSRTSLNVASIPQDARVQDAITIFNRDVKDNITNPYGQRKGYILCRIAAANTEFGGLGWTVFSIFTFDIFALFGMPMGNQQIALDLEVEIYDNDDILIGKYGAQSYNKTWIALYYGYSFSSAARKSNITAFRSAMNDIKSQIEKDSDRLLKELNK